MITKIPLALKCSDCPVCQLTLPLHWLTGRTRDALCAAPSPTAVGHPCRQHVPAAISRAPAVHSCVSVPILSPSSFPTTSAFSVPN